MTQMILHDDPNAQKWGSMGVRLTRTPMKPCLSIRTFTLWLSRRFPTLARAGKGGSRPLHHNHV